MEVLLNYGADINAMDHVRYLRYRECNLLTVNIAVASLEQRLYIEPLKMISWQQSSYFSIMKLIFKQEIA